MEWTRQNIKSNFLRGIVLRVDYEGIIDIKDILKKLEPELVKLDFTSRNVGFINTAEFELNDPEMIENELKIPIRDLNRLENYKYSNNTNEFELNINQLYSALNINVQNYKDVSKYTNIFQKVIESIRSECSYLKINRIGIRKINDCVIIDKNTFSDYFVKDYFFDISSQLKLKGKEVEKLNSQLIDTIVIDKYMFNYIRIATGGVLSDENNSFDVYQAVVDIDGYSYNRELLDSILVEESHISKIITQINDYLFELYSTTLTAEFKAKLLENQFNDKNIVGVKKNV